MSGSLGVDRKTLRKYVAPTVAAGIAQGSGPSRSEQEWHELVREWFPELAGRYAAAAGDLAGDRRPP